MKVFTKLLLCTLSLIGALQAMEPSVAQQSLFNAAKEGNVAGIDAALAQGARINAAVGPQKETALHAAAEAGRQKAAENLIKSEGDIDQQDAAGKTALHKALGNFFGAERHFDTAVYLIEHGAARTLVDNEGNTILHAAVTPSGHYFYDKLLDKLKGSVDVNAQNKVGKTALHKAIETGEVVIVQELLKHKPNPKVVDVEENTVLHSALKDNLSKPIIDALLEKDASLINQANKQDHTPLHTFVFTMNNIEENATLNPQTSSAQALLKNAQEVGEMLFRAHIDQANKEKAVTLALGSLAKKTIQGPIKV